MHGTYVFLEELGIYRSVRTQFAISHVFPVAFTVSVSRVLVFGHYVYKFGFESALVAGVPRWVSVQSVLIQNFGRGGQVVALVASDHRHYLPFFGFRKTFVIFQLGIVCRHKRTNITREENYIVINRICIFFI